MRNTRHLSTTFALVSCMPLLAGIVACPKKGANEVASLPPAAATTEAVAEMTPAAIKEGNPLEAAATAQPSPTAAVRTNRIPGSVTVARQGSASFKVAGHIARTLVRVGDTVKRGQILATLDDSDYRIRERVAAAGQSQAQVQFSQAKRDNDRELSLQKENATTQSALERASNTVTNADLAFQQAQLNHDQATKNLADTQLLSPFDGVISRRLKVEGEFVGVGAPVFELSENGNIEISLKVPENQLKEFKVGQEVQLMIPSANQASRMRITRIVPLIQESSRTFEVIGQPTGSGAPLVPGQFVEAQF